MDENFSVENTHDLKVSENDASENNEGLNPENGTTETVASEEFPDKNNENNAMATLDLNLQVNQPPLLDSN